MLLVGLVLRLGSEKVGETAKPASNWLAIASDAIVYITWVKSRPLIFLFLFFLLGSSALYGDLNFKSWTGHGR